MMSPLKSASPFILLVFLAVSPISAQAMTYANMATTFGWIDASTHTKVGYNTAPYKFNGGGGCGTTPPTIDDTLSDNIPIGFTFMYGGMNFTQARIMSNGRLQFNNTTCSYGSPVTVLPYPDATLNYTMRIYGNDLDPTAKSEVPTYNTACLNRATCYVSYATLGTAPYRSFVVTWNNVPEWALGGSTSGNYNLQIILQENGEFIYQYGANTPGPGNTTAQVGWQVNNTTDYDVPAVGYPASNSAIKFYIPRPVAEYRMEQPSWNGTAGEVFDTSGNGNHGNRAGSAQTTAAGKVCRGGDIPSNTDTTISAINSGIGIPAAVGGVGTISFWFKPNEWTGNTAQSNQLFDATIANNEWFFLTKRRIDNSNVRLRFSVRDSGGTTRTVETANLTSATLGADGSVHIAVTWNFNALAAANSDRLRIYVNGALSQTSAFTTASTLSANIGTLHIGDNRSTFIDGNGTARSANGIIDEFRIYNYEGGNALVLRDMNQTGGCLNHYAISHDGNGQTCQVETATITAHDNAHNPLIMPNNTTLITLSTSTGRGDWSLLNGYGPLNNGTADDGIATYLFNGEYQAVFGLSHSVAGPVSINITDGQIVEGASEDPLLTFASCFSNFNACHDYATSNCSAAGGRLYTRLSGSAFATDVVALDGSGNVAPSFTGKAVVSLIARATPGGSDAQNCFAPDYSQTLDNAATSFTAGRLALAGTIVPNAYREAKIRVACDATNCPPSGMTWCSVDSFSIRPQAFTVTADATVDNPATDKLPAGNVFTMTANSGYNLYTGTPVLDTTRLRDHNNLAAGMLNGSFPGAVGGSAAGMFQYQDVGTLVLITDAVTDGNFTSIDQPNDCTADSSNTLVGGKYGCIIGSTPVGPFGRFYPHHFNYTASLAPSCAAGGFTYMDEPNLGITLSLQARSANESLTTRYTNGYATLGAFTITGDNGGTPVDVSARLSPALPVFTWNNGAYTFNNAAVAFLRNPAPDGAYDNFALKAAVVDPDGAPITGSNLSNTTRIRFGRMKIGNAHGSELLPLPIPTRLLYFSNGNWVPNTLDSCTTVTANNFALAFPVSANNHLAACETALSMSGSAPNLAARLTAPGLPGQSNNGWTDLTLNLGAAAIGNTCTTVGGSGPAETPANKPWLQNPGYTNPSARATFGVYKGNNEFIYLREVY